MNRALIILVVVAAITVALNSLVLIYEGGMFSAWGALLASLPFSLYLWRIMVFKDLPSTTESMPWLIAPAGLGIAVATWGVVVGNEGPLGLIVTAAIAAGVVWYVFIYSELDRSGSRIEEGHRLPDFQLADLDGNAVSSGGLIGGTHMLVFYRGNWCPFCVAQINELALNQGRFEELGVTIMTASSQPSGKIRALQQRTGASFAMLHDQGGTAAKALGIFHPGGTPLGMEVFGYSADTVMPTVIITDAGGAVRWVHQTTYYRVRPLVEELIEVVEGLGSI